ncbi:hypothetical protein Q4Q34_08250 [Flavivirga abyssicola]|uniref:hypothetical protein n=1 Tax=Flavivirga abyssicola TaxID=3063533 RepID=UPI0026E0F493|nr:hypothetical protein [Flavivirga sp. MEBiC07777]WVK15018.1 hypothetical protein Q4Q34_08250 [Flavivirga sp. MEBiC07777]
MKKNKFMIAMAIATLTLFFMSCNKDESVTEDTLVSDSTSELVALEASIESVESVADSYSLYAMSSLEFESNIATGKSSSEKFPPRKNCHDRSGFFPDCTVFEEETLDNTVTITVSFPEDCVDRNGDVISGTIIIVKSTSDIDKTRTVTFTNFTINGHVINGTKTHEFIAANGDGNPQISGSVDISVETDEGTVTKVGTRLVVITSGGDTDTHKDDEKTVTGSHTFTNAEGNAKVVEITIPLVKPAACKYIVQGVKTYTVNGETSSLDYGDGTCDNIGTLTEVDGTVTEIELKRKRRKH